MNDINKSNDLLNTLSSRKKSNIKQTDCQACCSFPKSKVNFTQCQHLWCCRKCGQQFMLETIKANKAPRCYVQDCMALMRTDQKSLYEYFSNQAKLKYKQFQRTSISNPEDQRQETNDSYRRPPCIYRDCKGILIKNRCKRCRRQICQYCKKQSHPPNEYCQKQIPFIIQNSIQCPSCHQFFQKGEGCQHLTCFKCKYQFCFFCKKKWNKLHYTCRVPIQDRLVLNKKVIGCLGQNSCLLI